MVDPVWALIAHGRPIRDAASTIAAGRDPARESDRTGRRRSLDYSKEKDDRDGGRKQGKGSLFGSRSTRTGTLTGRAASRVGG